MQRKKIMVGSISLCHARHAASLCMLSPPSGKYLELVLVSCMRVLCIIVVLSSS